MLRVFERRPGLGVLIAGRINLYSPLRLTHNEMRLKGAVVSMEDVVSPARQMAHSLRKLRAVLFRRLANLRILVNFGTRYAMLKRECVRARRARPKFTARNIKFGAMNIVGTAVHTLGNIRCCGDLGGRGFFPKTSHCGWDLQWRPYASEFPAMEYNTESGGAQCGRGGVSVQRGIRTWAPVCAHQRRIR